MKILILGGAGMLGHQIWRTLRLRHDVWVTLRRPSAEYARFGLFGDGKALESVDAHNFKALEGALEAARPDVVVNCIGIIKQLKEAKSPVETIAINALLPHLLADWCDRRSARLIHFSTDCVFSGRKGGYVESDFPDAEDLYGRTKLLGETTTTSSLTLRTSIIGPELGTRLSLLEWFLAQKGKQAQGYRHAIYSGFTTFEMARIVESILTRHTTLHGLWQVSSEPISKYALLEMINKRLGLDVVLEPNDTFRCDRSLNSDRFRIATGYQPPSWPDMVEEIATYYNNARITATKL